MSQARKWPTVTFAAIACIALLAVVAIALRSAQSSAHRALENGFAEHAKVSAALTHSLFASTSQASASNNPRLYGAKRVSDGAMTAGAKEGKLSDLLLLAGDGTIIASSANTSAAVARSVQARPTYVRAALAGRQHEVVDVIRVAVRHEDQIHLRRLLQRVGTGRIAVQPRVHQHALAAGRAKQKRAVAEPGDGELLHT